MYLLQVYLILSRITRGAVLSSHPLLGNFFRFERMFLKKRFKFFQNSCFAVVESLLWNACFPRKLSFCHWLILQIQCTDQRILVFRKGIECSAKCFKIQLTKHIIFNAVIIIWNNLITSACPVFRLNVIKGYRYWWAFLQTLDCERELCEVYGAGNRWFLRGALCLAWRSINASNELWARRIYQMAGVGSLLLPDAFSGRIHDLRLRAGWFFTGNHLGNRQNIWIGHFLQAVP